MMVYLQVVRAKERIDQELQMDSQTGEGKQKKSGESESDKKEASW